MAALGEDWTWPEVPPRLGGGELARYLNVLRGRDERRVRRQHVVSQVLLRRFAEPDVNGGLVLSVSGLEYGVVRPRGTAACGFFEHWMPVLSESAERVWHEVESVLGDALDACRARADLSGQDVAVLRRAVAMHHVRSIHMRVVTQRAATEAFSELRATWLDNNHDLAVKEFRRVNGTDPRTRADLDALVDDVIERRGLPELEINFRIRAEEQFRRIATMMEQAPIEILRPPGRREFLVGDVPVCGYQPGNRAIGPRDGLGLYATKYFVMPLAPTSAIRLPAQGRAPYVTVSGRTVDEINVRQIRNAYREVYFRPSSRLGAFVEANRRVWRKPPDIDTLSVD